MKIAAFLLVFTYLFGTLPDIAKLRADYIRASEDKEVTMRLNDELSSVEKTDDKVLVAYKGAVLTLMAKYTKLKQEKKQFFREGAGLIEYAINANPNSIEIRVLRLSVQENSPKFLKYNQHITEDKQFILNQFKSTTSKELRAFVRNYIAQSNSFTSQEKEAF
jgi:hypothetical protein